MHSFSQFSSLEEAEISSPDSPNSSYEETTIDNKKIFRCLSSGCEKVFRFKSDIKRHVLIHAKEKPFLCSSCNRGFRRLDALRSHMQVHNQNFFYFCNVPGCDSRFSKMSTLQNHLLKHNNEKSLGHPSEFSAQNQNLQEYFQKQTPIYSQKSIQKESNNKNYFFDSFDDLAYDHDTKILPKNSFEENISNPKPQKFLHTEKGSTTCPKTSNEAQSPLDSEGFPPIFLKHFFQLMSCKSMLQENQKMRAKLGLQTDLTKKLFEEQLLSKINKALVLQFDFKENL